MANVDLRTLVIGFDPSYTDRGVEAVFEIAVGIACVVLIDLVCADNFNLSNC